MNYPAASGRSIKRPAAQNKFAASGGELNPKMIKLSTLVYFHRHPFDRIIISQGLTENIPIVSSDDVFDEYNVNPSCSVYHKNV